MSRRDVDGSPKWNGPKQASKARFNPSRTFVMNGNNNNNNNSASQSNVASSTQGFSGSTGEAMSPASRRFNPKSNFSPSIGSSSPSPTPRQSSLATPIGPALMSTAAPGVSAGVAPVGSGTGTEALEYASLYHPPLHPLQYHMYAPTPYRVHMHDMSLAPHERTVEDLFLSADLRKELIDRNEATLQVLPASNLPEFVHVYHSLVPLDLGKGIKDERMFGQQTYRYKAVSHTDGRTYCLLRVDGFQPGNENEHPLQAINKWKRAVSSSIVGVVEAFTTVAFLPTAMAAESAAQSLIVVYEWWPLAKPLSERMERRDLSEASVWAIAVQVFGALEVVHRRQLAARGAVDEKFVLETSNDRVRLGSLGLRDVLEPETNISEAQAQDLRDLASLIERLSVNAAGSPTPVFSEIISALRNADRTLAQQLIAPHATQVMDAALAATDSLEATLSTELENGRLVRLLAKLEFTSNDSDADPASPRHALFLFRNYVFKQQTIQGKPSLNLAHALAALNKLDAGVDENVLLTSKNGETRIVVSYKELNQMFGDTFDSMVKSYGSD